MAVLNVFISSTCYDLSSEREYLRKTLKDMGHDVTLSEFGDVIFDPSLHAHASCLEEVKRADIVVLIIGGRFGEKIDQKALSEIDIASLGDIIQREDLTQNLFNLSVTQLEVITAISSEIPIYAFVKEAVYFDYFFYEANEKNVNLRFPSLMDVNSSGAKYIFDFIDFIRKRRINNAIERFSKLKDLEWYLKKQWSGLFKKMLDERRRSKHRLECRSLGLSCLMDKRDAMKELISRIGDVECVPESVLMSGVSLSEILTIHTLSLAKLASNSVCKEFKIVIKEPDMYWSNATYFGMGFLPPYSSNDSCEMCKISKNDLQKVIEISQKKIEGRTCKFPPNYVFVLLKYKNYSWGMIEFIQHGVSITDRKCLILKMDLDCYHMSMLESFELSFFSLWNDPDTKPV